MTDPRDVFPLPESCPDWGFTPTEMLPPDKQQARRERILIIKKRMERSRKIREERAHKPRKPIPLPPVYDDVWAEGMRLLSLFRIAPEETE